jgi:signal transduction histidine kinase
VFWPATGVGIAVLYVWGLRWWPGLLLGELLAWEFNRKVPLETAAGDTARSLVAAVILIQLVGKRAAMNRLRQVGAVLVAVAAGAALAATVAMISLRLRGALGTSGMPVFWRGWWLGDLSGGLVVVPLVLAWTYTRPRAWRNIRIAETVLMLAAVAGLSAVALSTVQPVTYVVFPALIWAALRFGPPWATVAVALATAIAILITANDAGAFIQHSPSDSVLNLQLYICFAALTTLCLAAIVSERRQATAEAARDRARIRTAGARERRRLEADLHDGAQNRLIALLIRLQLTRDKAQQTSPALVPALDELVDEAQRTTDELRRVARGVLPPTLSSKGVAAALREETAHSAVGVSVVGNVGRSEEDIEFAVYLGCLEAVQNAARHAGPDATVTVTLQRKAGDLLFNVADTGVGFDTQATTPGAGLTNVPERFASLGGHVDVASTIGHGTTVTGVVPWPHRPE